jgi:hypothetical protein
MHLKDKILEDLRSDPKVTIYKTIKGKKASEIAKKVFIKNDTTGAEEWISKWSEQERKNAVLVVYVKQMRTKEYIMFKFIIGESVLGQKM